MMYLAAATLRREAWRFDYGRKMTPKRVAGFPLKATPSLLEWINVENKKSEAIEMRAINDGFGACQETTFR
jgi:hypothetical protein